MTDTTTPDIIIKPLELERQVIVNPVDKDVLLFATTSRNHWLFEGSKVATSA
jgi:hypothetical protein